MTKISNRVTYSSPNTQSSEILWSISDAFVNEIRLEFSTPNLNFADEGKPEVSVLALTRVPDSFTIISPNFDPPYISS